MQTRSYLPLLLFIVLFAGLLFIFGNVFANALLKLNLSPQVAPWAVMLIFIGSMVNLPVKRIVRLEPVAYDPFAILGFSDFTRRFRVLRSETTVAVNLGGCIVPSLIALYEVGLLFQAGWHVILVLAVSVGLNVGVCYWIARPVESVGIVIPGLIPPLTAALCALNFAPDHAVPVAFVAGIAGPLVGADLFHIREIERLSTGMLSIGGAGTFDGIVLSGIVAVYLA